MRSAVICLTLLACLANVYCAPLGAPLESPEKPSTIHQIYLRIVARWFKAGNQTTTNETTLPATEDPEVVVTEAHTLSSTELSAQEADQSPEETVSGTTETAFGENDSVSSSTLFHYEY